MRTPGFLTIAVAVVLCSLAAACSRNLSDKEGRHPTQELTVLCDWSVEKPVREVAAEFEKTHPNVKVKTEIAGNLGGARMIADGSKKADVFIASDCADIETMMMPKTATWYIKFARNYIEPAFTDKSRFAAEINSVNWYDYLVKPGVKIGCVDPNADPLGYRSLMVMQLVEAYYGRKGLAEELKKNCAPQAVGKDGTELAKKLAAGDLDYAWLYGSEVRQNGLRYIVLPPETDLSSGSYADDYKKVKVEVVGPTPGTKRTVVGEPILYGVTVPVSAEHKEAAVTFLKTMLGPVGQQVFEKNAQKQLTPCEASDRTKVPAELVEFCRKEKG